MIIEGINAVGEALNASTTVEKLYIEKGVFSDRLNRLVAEARRKNVKILFCEKGVIDKLSPTQKHQGALAVATEFSYADFEEMVAAAIAGERPALLVLLEGVEDPHNLGAVIRVADSVGASGVIIPKYRSATVNETVLRTSAGAAAHVPVAKVTNINDAVRYLKDNGIPVYAADMGGTSVYETRLDGAVAVVIGGEGNGVNALTIKLADGVISLPQLGKVNSLNASVACGAILYEAVRQRLYKK